MHQAEESTSRSFGRDFRQVRVGCWYKRKNSCCLKEWRNFRCNAGYVYQSEHVPVTLSSLFNYSIGEYTMTRTLAPFWLHYSSPSTMSEWILYLLNASVYVWNCATSRRSRGLENPTKKWMVQKHTVRSSIAIYCQLNLYSVISIVLSKKPPSKQPSKAYLWWLLTSSLVLVS